MASLQTKYLQLTKATATGVQTFTGVGFTGKALLLWTTYQTASGATTAAVMSLGMTDGVLQSCRFINHPGGEASTTSSQAEQTDHIIYKVSATSGATPTVQVAGVFGAFTSDGFTINFTTNDGNADLLHAIVLGGDISAAFTQVKIDVDAPNSIDVTGVGFRPSAYIVMGGAADEFGTGDYNVGAPFGSIHGFGFSNASENICGWTLGRGTAGAADCYRGQMLDEVASVRVANLSGAATTMDARITAHLDDGYTITRDAGTTIAQPVQHVLCLKGVRFALGSFTAPLTAIDKVVAVPFQPDLVILQSMGTTASENTADMGLAMGAWQRADTDSGGIWIGGVDAANPSVYRRSTYADLVLETRDASSGSAVMQATVDATSDTDITFGFSAVSGNADAILYMSIAATDTIRGSFVAGEKTTVRAKRSAAFGLDGVVNEFAETGKLKVFGKIEATETVTVGDLTGSTATALVGAGPSGVLEGISVGAGLDLTGNTLLSTVVSGGGNVINADAFGSEPSGGSPGPSVGDLEFYTNSFYVGRYDGTSPELWAPWGPIYPMTLPVDGDFSWVNQGDATVDATRGPIILNAPVSANLNDVRARVQTAPSTPYTITIACIPMVANANFIAVGMCWRQSSDGKLVTAGLRNSGLFEIAKWNSPTSFSAAYTGLTGAGVSGNGRLLWLRLTDNGTDRIVSYGFDGITFQQLHTIGRTDFMTANQIGLFVNPNSADLTISTTITVLSWVET